MALHNNSIIYENRLDWQKKKGFKNINKTMKNRRSRFVPELLHTAMTVRTVEVSTMSFVIL